MKLIIQCCASKQSNAGTFHTPSGKPIKFAADPSLPEENISEYIRPDDIITGSKISWRDHLWEYNDNYKKTHANPNSLLRAGELYRPSAYSALVKSFGYESVYILSAGWGLVRSDYLIPVYDITFSSSGGRLKKRKKSDHYHDFNHMIDDQSEIQKDETIYFFGGNSYLPLLYILLSDISARKIIYYISSNIKKKNGFTYIQYNNPSGRRTNWHYDCVKDFISGRIKK